MATIGQSLIKPEAGWKRFENASNKIIYFPSILDYITYTHSTNTSGGTSSYHVIGADAKKLDQYYVCFKFKGTKIRYIDFSNGKRPKTNAFIIDGVKYTFNPNAFSLTAPTLFFEVTELEDKIHSVIYKPNEMLGDINNHFSFDAIDIDEEGYLIEEEAPFPILKHPEKSWKRYDNLENTIYYTGNWSIITNAVNHYSTSVAESNTKNDKLSFRFTGSKLRIISEGGIRNSDAIEININGNIERISVNKLLSSSNKCASIYEKLELETNMIHTCEITNKTNSKFVLDAIDIEEGAVIFPNLSKDYEFPVKTIEKADVEAYAASCINEEEQLLIAIEDGSMYLTKGDGTYITACDNQVISKQKDMNSDIEKLKEDLKAKAQVIESMNSKQEELINIINKMLETSLTSKKNRTAIINDLALLKDK